MVSINVNKHRAPTRCQKLLEAECHQNLLYLVHGTYRECPLRLGFCSFFHDTVARISQPVTEVIITELSQTVHKYLSFVLLYSVISADDKTYLE